MSSFKLLESNLSCPDLNKFDLYSSIEHPMYKLIVIELKIDNSNDFNFHKEHW